MTFDQNVSERYFVSAYQRSEVPNETVLEKPSVTVDMGDGRVASDATEIAQIVSAAPQWDVSKNHINNEENTGFVNRVARACPWDETKSCWLVDHSLLISAESSGKGATPLTGDVTLVDNLDPRKFYQIDGLDPAFWDDPANVEKYAPRLAKCADKDHLYSMPNPRVGEGYEPRDTENSVRESGVATCEHTPGEDMTITLSDTDWSLYTYPTKIPSTNREIPQPGRAYAVSVIVKIAIPLDAVKDLGYSASDISTAKNLDYKNVYTDFHATDLNGDVQDASVDEAWNNYRIDTVWVRPPKVSANKYWAGITDDPLNTPASQYTKGDPTKQGPPGSTVQYGGDIPASAGQVILSSVTLNGSNLSNPQKVTGLLCDSWDNSKLHLQAEDYPGGKSYGAHMFPSEGKAVWAGGRLDFPEGHASDYVVEYSGDAHSGGDMPGESESMCRTGTWYSDPADVPGNDPALISQGRYTGVNAVRIYAKLPEPANNATWLIREHYNIALRVVEGQAEKTIIPNWLGYTTGWGSEYSTKDDLLSGGEGLYEVPTNYHPENHRGDAGLGDRLHYAPAYVRIGKEVRPVGEDSFTRIASATAGDEIEWRIKTTLHSAAPKGGTPQPVTIEDCLPPDFSYVDASVAPSLVQPAPAPADAELTCDEGTYVRWILEDRVANEPIDPIIMRTRISAFAVSETYRNVSSVQTLPLDPSPLQARTSDAFVDVAAVQGVRIEKTALTPITQVNIAGREHLQQNVWEVALYNQDFKDVVRNVDVIDALPVANGINGSDFEGTMTFVSAELTDGENVQILYTSAPTVLTDPTVPENSDTGIAWCDAPAGGTLVTGVGECPRSASEVTGLRFLKPTELPSGDGLSVKVTMVPEGNVGGNVYVNRAEAKVEGLKYNVGPVDAPEQVVSSSIGDYVWSDLDNDGIQDDGEQPYEGQRVLLSGTDDLGNPVSVETVSAADGSYHFTNLREGSYTVTFDPDGMPHGREFSPQGVGTDRALDSDGDPASGVVPTIELKSGENRTDIDQGVAYKVGDVIWSKVDNGTAEGEEQPVTPSGQSTAGSGNTHPAALLEGSQWLLRGTDELTKLQGDLVIEDCVAEPCTGLDLNPVVGEFRLADLYWGSYELIETKAPAGYQLDETPIAVTLGADEVASIDVGQIANLPYDFDLPHTGGVASLIFLGTGGGLLGLAALSGGAQLRRRQRTQS